MVEIAAFVISGLSLLVAAIGTHLANKRANEALAASRNAAVDARWFAVQEAVQRLIGFDPTAQPVDERLQNLRITMIALADQLEGWDGIDSWLDAERTLGATIGRQVMEVSEQGDSVEQRVKNLELLTSWAQVLSNNLRLFRSTGHNASVLAELRSNAEALVRSIHERHGWELPPSTNPRVRPLN
jgi:hypothetical protein